MAVVNALARGLSVQPIKWLHVLSACALIILGLQTVSGGPNSSASCDICSLTHIVPLH